MSTARTSLTESNMRWFCRCLAVSFFIISSVLLGQMSKGEAALAPEEEIALEVLREAFQQPRWEGAPCFRQIEATDWITCSSGSPNDSHVEEIDLTRRDLTGTIPPDIAKLQKVYYLRLSHNKLEGPIPDLRKMTNLIKLDLTGNRLSGRILNTSSFTNISQLLIGDNHLSGEIPQSLFQHSSITQIDLSGNSIGGPIPDMSELTNLNFLDLQNNKINGSIPASMNKLTRADEIILRNNSNLKGTVPDLSGLVSMGYFDARYCGLTGLLPGLENSESLQAIYLAYNDFTGNITPALFKHPMLQRLILNNNPRLSGDIPDTSLLTNVEMFYLFDCNFGGALPSSLEGNTKLRELNVANNKLTSMPHDFRNLSLLQMIDVSNNNMSGNLPELPAGSTQGTKFEYFLTELKFSGNRFSGEIPKSWSQLIFLERMALDDNSLTDGIPPGFGNLVNLELLNLSNNQLSSLPSDLRNLTRLRKIDVSNNRMSGNLPELHSGSTPTSIEGLQLLTELNFSHNYFTGEIPKSWTDLTSLEKLVLNGNQIRGTIPTAFGNLKNLKELDLRNNLLGGAVPDTLKYLLNLTILRLDHNNFTEIPQALTQKKGLHITYDNNPNITVTIVKSNDLSAHAIVGVVIGVVAGSIVLLWLLIYVTRRRRSKYKDQLSTEDMPKSARAFTLKEIKTITANNKTLIGKGGFGQVYYGQLPDGKEVAVKVRAVDSKQGAEEFLNEVRLLSRLHHRNLVPLVGYCLEAHQQILVYHYMSQGTLYNHLYQTGSNVSNTRSSEPSTNQPLDWRTRLDIAINAARGLEYLHKDCNPPVIHRDVKSSNILLTEKLHAKVSDLGISKQAREPDSEDASTLSGVSTAIKGTFGYLDPEYFVRRKLTTKSDVYSFGIVLLEIISGRRPQSHNFPNTDETNLVDWVRDAVANDQVQSIVDPAFRDQYMPDGLLKVAKAALCCVSTSGAERPSMGEIVHVLIEALQMEGPHVQSSTPATTEINVPFFRQVGSQLETPLRSSPSSRQSLEALAHPSWNTDPR